MKTISSRSHTPILSGSSLNTERIDIMEKLLSYIMPVRLKTFYSEFSGRLEINMINGKRVLDTANTNYSYGSLQRILHKGLSEIGFDNAIKKVLVLGMGGGSVVQTIRENFNSVAHIVLVEIDPEIINIAIDEFNINRFENINIIQADALDYLRSNHATFDLILVDLFLGDTIPKSFTESAFIRELMIHLNPHARLIFNTIRNTLPTEAFIGILNAFLENDANLNVLEEIEQTNCLILVEKLSQHA